VGLGFVFASRFGVVVCVGVDGLGDGAVLSEKVIAAVKPGGAIASVRPFEGTRTGGLIHHAVRVTAYATQRAKLDRLRVLVQQSRLTLRVAEIYPASQAADAHRRLEAGGTRGRLVLTFDG
jgi:NADPH:quinone reductase-like Zn-dependent oxidoreductase